MTKPCDKEEFLGEVKEFIANSKGLKATMFTLAIAILIQVGTFLFLWGGLTTTVKNHDKSIDKMLTKLDNIKIVYAQGENGR
jgi:hypothetical protein